MKHRVQREVAVCMSLLFCCAMTACKARSHEQERAGAAEQNGKTDVRKEPGKQAVEPSELTAVVPKNPNEKEGALDCVLQVVGEAKRKPLILELAIHNRTRAQVEFCRYQTPFEKPLTSSSVFEVLESTTGASVEYEGMAIKRLPPSRSNGDYIALAPGEHIASRVDISQNYTFHPGKYRVRFQGSEMNGLPSSNFVEIDIP